MSCSPTKRRAGGVDTIPLSNLSLNSASPSRQPSSKSTKQPPKSIFATSGTVSSTQTTRKKASSSPTKGTSRSRYSGEDDLTGNLTGTYDAPSRRSSPSKQSSASLAAGGGVGRSGVVNNDWDPSSLAGESKRSPSKKGRHYDRYIPSRQSGSGDHTGPILLPTPHSGSDSSPQNAEDAQHTADLSRSLGINSDQRILSFFAEPPMPQTEHSSLLAQYARLPNKGSAGSSSSAANAASRRRIPTQPERVLDAPGMVDDYYLNVVDWSSTNLLAIGLGEVVYIWNAQTGEVNELCSVGSNSGDSSALTEGDEYVCSLKFTEDGSHLAVGLSSGPIMVYDVCAGQRLRTLQGHPTRVPSLSWSGAILASGCRSGEIWNSDVRIAQHNVAQLKGHRGEVCGLEWRPEIAGGLSGGGQGLLASGGNDNVVNVWDCRMTTAPKMSKTNHTAAVKALAWCPWNSSLLASGGGSSDKTIHFWNTTQSARLNSLVTNSQVTSLVWNPHAKELLSTHGVPDHHIALWSYPSLSKVAEIPNAHQSRILHSSLSPDGMTVVTASSDEDLKFWKMFEMPKGVKAGAGRSLTGKDLAENDGIGRKGKTGISVR
ncbi:WD repeat protein, cell division cycle 20, cofactorof APC complex [Rhodotorula toruloides]|uniref:WD repeat protein, cell division cycle 20, cofactorof APC complex n=1 Tax=Rhodotorula toruloides TaxID=5286 RepID=A0A511KHB7_RHOTO|nr:WD repeat protein, cell division cycle 20, cofactorof APC complex [Rhodotorula toruloides]